MTESPFCTVWPELKFPRVSQDKRLAPYLLARSAVFAATDYAGNAIRPVIKEPLALEAIRPYVVEQVAGVRLSQSDADLFYWLLARAYEHGAPKGNAVVSVNRSEALSALARPRGGKTDSLLDDSLMRLHKAEFTYKIDEVSTRFRLVSFIDRIDKAVTKEYQYRVTLSGSVAALLDDGEWVAMSGKERGQLAGDPLAKGLHAFYASHKTPFPMLPSRLKKLMGRESMQDSKWQHALVKALATVKGATGWPQCEFAPALGKVVVTKGFKPPRYPRKPSKDTLNDSDSAKQGDI